MVIPPALELFLRKQHTPDNLCLPQHYPTLQSLESFQEGYRFNNVTGKSLVSNKPGKWKEEWYVIAKNYFDDPFYIDISQIDETIYFSRHGAGTWRSIEVCPNLAAFEMILAQLVQLNDTNSILELLQNHVNQDNEFWQEVIQTYHEADKTMKHDKSKESILSNPELWLYGKVILTDFGKQKLQVVRYLAKKLNLTIPQALKLTQQQELEVAVGYLIHVKSVMETLESLGATIIFKEQMI